MPTLAIRTSQPPAPPPFVGRPINMWRGHCPRLLIVPTDAVTLMPHFLLSGSGEIHKRCCPRPCPEQSRRVRVVCQALTWVSELASSEVGTGRSISRAFARSGEMASSISRPYDKLRHFPFVASCRLRRVHPPSTLGPF